MSIAPNSKCIVCGYKILNTTTVCPACGAEQSDSDASTDTSTSTSMDTSADTSTSTSTDTSTSTSTDTSTSTSMDTSTSTSMDTSTDSASSSNLKSILMRYFNDHIPPREITIFSSEQLMISDGGPTGPIGATGPTGPSYPTGPAFNQSIPTRVLSGNGPPSIPPQNNGDIYIDLDDYTHYVVMRGEWILKERD